MYKDFLECCVALSRNHLVGILSNLSIYTELREIVYALGAKNLFAIGGSVHIAELDRLNKTPEFFRSLELLLLHGVPCFVIYNMGDKLESYFDWYVKQIGANYGVPIFAKYKQGSGPINTSVYKTVEAAGVNMSWFTPYDIGRAAIPGMKCGAGVVSLNVDALNGKIQKCIYDQGNMGNIYTGEFNPAINSFCTEHCYCHTYLFPPGFSDCYDNWAEFNRLVKPNIAKN